MILTPERERRIVEGSRTGKTPVREAAFHELVEVLGRPLLALCLQHTGNHADAEDALQDVLLAVYSALPRFEGRSRLTTWIYRIALRVSLRVKAKGSRHRAADLMEEPACQAQPDPMVRREESGAVAAALQGLSAEHRTVLLLFVLEGHSHQEIADILGVPVGTVWSRLHNARKKLASRLRAAKT